MDVKFIQLKKLLMENVSILPDKSEENPVNTLKALWLTVSGTPVSALKSESMELPELSKDEFIKLENLVMKRLENVPLAHLTGRQSFMGLEMLAGPEALIPRKETEILGYTSLEILNKISVDRDEICLIDVCTGAGNIAVALASNNNKVKVYAADLSEEAVELARKNVTFMNLSDRVELFSGDLLNPFIQLNLTGKVDLLTCNPPYISSSKVADMPSEISGYEPELAFDGGSFGINLIRRLIVDAVDYLKPDAYLVFEVGLGQGEVLKKQVEKSGLYKNIYTVNDDSQNARVIVAQKLK